MRQAGSVQVPNNVDNFKVVRLGLTQESTGKKRSWDHLLFFPSADDTCWLVGLYTTNHHHHRHRRRIHCRTQKFPFRHLHNRCSPV